MNYSDKFGATSFQEVSSPFAKGGLDFSTPGNTAAQQTPSGFIKINDAELLFSGNYKREGSDLVISNDVRKIVVPDYFKGEVRPTLTSRDGATLSGKIVDALTGHVTYAQASGQPEPPKEIGTVGKLTGTATAIRNGVAVDLKIGDKVYKGDVLQSGPDSALGVTFIDGTVFSLSSNARMVLNEMVYDANSTSNSSLLSLVQGTITFVAGQTAKNGNMRVDTPVATMGIRGTAVLVEIGADNGPTKFSVLIEPGNKVGQFNLYDKTTGSLIGTVSQAGQVTLVTPGGIGQQATAVELQKTLADLQSERSIIKQAFELFFPNFNDANPQGTKNAGSSVNNLANVLIGTQKADVGATVLDAKFTPTGGGGPVSVTGTVASNAPPIVVTNATDIQPPEEKGGKFNIADQVGPKDDAIIPYIAGSLKLVSAEGPSSMPPGFGLGGLVTFDPATGDVTYTPGNFRFLADGEKAIFTFSFQSQSGEFIFVKTLTLTIDGLNDTPIFTSDDFKESVAEPTSTASNDTFSTQRTLTFTDLDFSDVASGYTIETLGVTATGKTIAVPNTAALLSFLHFNSVTKAIGTTQGVITETFTAPASAFDYLAVGESVDIIYQIKVSDADGASRTATLTVTVTGTNDAPTITGATTPASTSGDLTEDGVLTASGVITFRDVDLSNTHTAVAALTGGTISAPLPGFIPATSSLGSLSVHVNENTTDANNIGTVSWSYSLDNLVAQRLAEGQVVTQTFTVTITDSSNATVTQPVTVTITGTNDVPEVVLSQVTLGDDSVVQTNVVGAITEPLAAGAGTESANGIVVFKDLDLIDSHTASFVVKSSSATADLPGFNEGVGTTDAEGAVSYIGTFALSSSINESGTDLIDLGAVGWTFTINKNDPTLQSLAEGQTITQVYTITITDSSPSHATVTKDVTVTITGTNDAPVIDAVVDTPLDEQTDNKPLTATIGVTFTDVDLIDIGHTATVTGVDVDGVDTGLALDTQGLIDLLVPGLVTKTGTSANGSFDLTFTAPPGTFDYLADGEELALTYTVTVDDGDTGGVSTQTVKITITGTNDAPVIGGTTQADLTEAQAGQPNATSLPLISFNDVDLADVDHTASVTNVVATGAVTGLALDDTQLKSLIGIEFVTKAEGSTNGTVTLGFSAFSFPTAFDYLATNEVLTLTYTLTIDDGDGGLASRDFVVTITGANDAPVLTVGPYTDLTAITEDDVNNAGQTVASFIGASITDADHNAVEGIAITGSQSQNGYWEFSTDGGAHWSQFGNYTALDALLLSADDKVRFIPNGENGGTDTFSFVAWDRTIGAHGATADTTNAGGTSAFSTQSGVARVEVTSVNDAPVITSNGGGASTSIDFAENSTDAVTTVTATDVDQGATVAYSIVTGAGSPDSAFFTMTPQGVLSFIAPPDYESQTHGSVYTVQVRAWDGSAEDIQTITVNVTNVAEGFAAANDTIAATEDTATGGLRSALIGNDSNPGNLTLTITAVGNAQGGTIALNGGNPIFTPSANFSGVATFDYTVSNGVDAPSTALVTVNVAPVADAVNLNVAVNGDTPAANGSIVLVNATETGNQQDPTVEVFSDGTSLVIWRSDQAGANAFYARKLDASGQPVGSEVQIATNAFSNGYDTTLLSNGNVLLAWNTSGAQVYVQEIDPNGSLVGSAKLMGTGSDVSVSATDAGGAFVSWGQNIGGGNSNIRVRSIDSAGNLGTTLTVNTNTSSSNFETSIVALDDGGFAVAWRSTANDSLRDIFVRIYDENGLPVSAALQVNTSAGEQAWPDIIQKDDGTIVVAWSSRTVPATDPWQPVVRVLDTNGAFLTGEIVANTTMSASPSYNQIVNLPDGGYLVVWQGGTGSNYGQRFDAANNKAGAAFAINASDLAIDPNGNIVAVKSVFPFDAQGDGVVASRFDVPYPSEDHAVAFSISATLADTDGSEAITAIRLTGYPTGATFSVGTADVTPGVWIISNHADIVSLASTPLTMTPPQNFNGNFTLHIDAVATETANGSIAVTTRDVPVTISAVNDAPVAVASSIAAVEDVGYVFASADFQFNDADSPADVLQSVIIVSAPATGRLFHNGYQVDLSSGPLTVSKADIDAGLLQYVSGVNGSGNAYAAFSFRVIDGGATNNTSNVATMTINVSPYNDAPVVDLNSSASGANYAAPLEADGNPFPISLQPSVFDVDSATISGATVVLTNGEAGDFFYVPNGTTSGTIGPLSWVITGTAGDLDHPLTLTFSGVGTQADYAFAIEQTSFGSTSSVGGARSIAVQLDDGAAQNNLGNVAIATITVSVPQNVAPAITIDHALESFVGVDNGRSVPSTVLLPNLGISGDSAVTVEFWLKDGLTTNQSSMLFGFQQYDLIAVGYPDARGHVLGFNTGNGDVLGIQLPLDFADGWHHIAAVFKPGLYGSQLYIDGQLQQLQSLGDFGPSPGQAYFTDTAYIGGWGVTPTYSFQGQIDDLRVWHGERSEADINGSMHVFEGSLANLVAHYQFEQVGESPGEVTDSSGNGHHGTLSGFTIASNIVEVDSFIATEDRIIRFSDDNAIQVVDANNDVLTLDISVTSGTLTYGSPNFGLVSYDGFSLQYVGNASEINTFLRTMEYQGLENFTGQDTLFISISDGIAPAVEKQITIDVRPVNDAPVLDLDDSDGSDEFNYATTTVNDGNAISIVGTPDISDVDDDQTVTSATVRLLNAEDGDYLDVDGILPGNIQFTVDTSVPGQILLTLYGTAPNGAYEAALQQVVFGSNNGTPGDRSIEVIVSDGADSDSVISQITVEQYTPSGNEAPIAGDDNLFARADYGAFKSSLAYNDYDPDEDQFAISGAFHEAESATFDPMTHVYTIEGLYGTLQLFADFTSNIPFGIGGSTLPGDLVSANPGDYIFTLGKHADGSPIIGTPVPDLQPGHYLTDTFTYTITDVFGNVSEPATVTVRFDPGIVDVYVTPGGYSLTDLHTDLYNGLLDSFSATHINLTVGARNILITGKDLVVIDNSLNDPQDHTYSIVGGLIKSFNVYQDGVRFQAFDFNLTAVQFDEGAIKNSSAEFLIEEFAKYQYSIHGSSGADHLTGGDLDDRIDAGSSTVSPITGTGDQVFAGDGNDLIIVHDDNQWFVDGGDGVDTLRASGSFISGLSEPGSELRNAEIIDLGRAQQEDNGAVSILIDGAGANGINDYFGDGYGVLRILGDGQDTVRFKASDDDFPGVFWVLEDSGVEFDGGPEDFATYGVQFDLYVFKDTEGQIYGKAYVQQNVQVVLEPFAPVLDITEAFATAEISTGTIHFAGLHVNHDADEGQLFAVDMEVGHGSLSGDFADDLNIFDDGSDGLTFGATGTLAEINEVIQSGITYTPADGTPDMLTISVSDETTGQRDVTNFIFVQADQFAATLTGTTEKDIFIGSINADQFVFAPGNGHDIITNYQAGLDHIDLQAFPELSAVSIVPWLASAATQQGSDTLLNLDPSHPGQHTILLQNVQKTAITVNDFVLHPGM